MTGSERELRRDRLSLVLLAPLLLFCVVVAAWAPFRESTTGIDGRSHVDMIRAIAEHGLPYFSNGPLERDFPELQVAWNIRKGGRLWGTYPPLFAYVSTPLFMIGGLRAVSGLCIATMLPILIGTFMLARRVLRSAVAAVVATYAVVGTQIAAMALDIGPYGMMVALTVWAAYFTLVALETGGTRAALLAGLLAGLAVATHLLAFPMVGALLGLLFVVPDGVVTPSGTEAPPSSVASWWPTPTSLTRGAWALGGLAFPLVFVAALNRLRFDTPNPFTYGPCAWAARCAESQQAKQNIVPMLRFAGPFLAWCAATAVAAFMVRRTPRLVVAVLIVALVPMLLRTVVRQRGLAILSVALGYTFDVHHLTEPVQPAALDGLGSWCGPWITALSHGSWVVKAPLQESPLLLLSVLAPFAGLHAKRATLLLALPCAALLALVSLRANLPGIHALGWPGFSVRYAIPVIPFLSILAVSALKDLPWRRAHLCLGLAVAAVLLTVFLRSDGTDSSYLRRVFLLRITLAAGVAAAVCTCLARKRIGAVWTTPAALISSTLAAAFGVAIAFGIDLPAMIRVRVEDEALVHEIAQQTPQRFALVGYGGDVDVALTLRATRDLEAADLYEASPGHANLRALIDYWTEQQRPIFGIFVYGKSPWPDVTYKLLDRHRMLYAVIKEPNPVFPP